MTIHRDINTEIRRIHDKIQARAPHVVRIGCALHDPHSDEVTTFAHSTKQGEALQAYGTSLSSSRSLQKIARTGRPRYIADLEGLCLRPSAHNIWLKRQKYQSSFTVPMYEGSHFQGFIFFDSMRPDGIPQGLRNELSIYAEMISDTISREQTPVRIMEAVARLRDGQTADHLDRMAGYSRLIATGLARQGIISDETAEDVYVFSTLHDIGKIAVPNRILGKPGPLTTDEYAQVQTHVQAGVGLIDMIGDRGLFTAHGLGVLRNVIAHHHERLDGSGYPAGLRGNQISIEGRIVAVADVFDALTSERPYKRAWSVPKAIAELRRMVRRHQLDARCVAVLEAQEADLVKIGRAQVAPVQA